jgi:hypothetical protein
MSVPRKQNIFYHTKTAGSPSADPNAINEGYFAHKFTSALTPDMTCQGSIDSTSVLGVILILIC